MIDLGFFPWTALAEGLLREPVEKKSRRAVADCIKERDTRNMLSGNPDNEPNWESWLQQWRVELNAMTTAEFVDWMNAQFAKHGAAKTIPPEEMALQMVTATVQGTLAVGAGEEARAQRQTELNDLHEEIARRTEDLHTQIGEIEQEIAEEAKKIASERFREIKRMNGPEVVFKIKAWLKQHDHSRWPDSIGVVASDLMSIKK